MRLKCAYRCQKHVHKLGKEESEKKNVQRASYGYHWNLTLAIVLSATSFINFRGNKIMINIEN